LLEENSASSLAKCPAEFNNFPSSPLISPGSFIPEPFRRRVAFVVLTIFVIVLAQHARRYLPFVSDDALISLRYARRLLDGYGLTWTDGRPVEGYSNLLWTLAVAFVGLFRVDLITAARALGFAGMIVIMGAVAAASLRAHRTSAVWVPLILALLFLSACAPIAVWAIGGLEQPLCGALLAVAIASMSAWLDAGSRGAGLTLSLSLGLLCLTRPDGPLFAAAAALALVAARGFRWIGMIDAGTILVGPIVLTLGQVAFRWFYYGELVPNTALVKLTPSGVHSAAGWRYLTGGVSALEPLSGLAMASLVAMLFDRRARGRGGFLAITAIVWSAYVVFIGGDIFPAYRHLIPLIVVFAFALADGLALILERAGSSRMAMAVAAVAGIALSVPYVRAQSTDRQAHRAIRERWEWQGRDLALALRAAFGRQRPLMAVTAAGCLPYWSGFPSLDMMGLNDYYIPRHPPGNLGQGSLGHELGDGAYVLERAPDLIVFNVGTEPAYRSGEQLNTMPEFHRRYVPVRIRVEGSEEPYIVYADKYSEKIGIRRTAATTTLPAFVFQGREAVARLDAMNRLVVPLTQAAPLETTIDADAAKDWSVEVDASNPSAIAASARRIGDTVSITLRATGPDPVDVRGVVLRLLW
jgi:arabinofuranosyltransferase